MAELDNICVGGLEVCPHEHAVLAHGRDVPLSTREFEILRMLAEHPGWVFSTDQLSGNPESGEYSPDSVSVLVSRLRHKLTEAGEPDVVETVRGVGYRLRAFREGDAESAVTSPVCHELRDAGWRLLEAALEAERSGTPEQLREVAEVFEQARRAVFAALAE